MNTFTGMDIAQVRQLSTQMTCQADQIQQIMSQLTSALQGTPWVGPDREQFLAEWQGTHCAQLNAVVNGLRDAATKANLNAQQQEAASNS